MKVNVNTMLEMELDDLIAIRKTIRMCNELIVAFSHLTVCDEAYMACADNGEIIANKTDLKKMVNMLITFDNIFYEAPYKNGDASCSYKELAVNFIG